MYIHINMHLYTHTCTHIYIRMHMHTYAQIENLSNNASMRQAIRTTHDARTCTLMPNKSVALSASAYQVSLH